MKPTMVPIADDFFQVAGSDDVPKMRKLITDGSNINGKDSSGKTPLHYAALTGAEEIVHLLLVNKAEVNVRDNGRRTPLFLAVQKGRLNVVNMLLTFEASAEATDKYHKTCIHYAVEVGHCKITEALMNASRTLPQTARDLEGRTALHYAAFYDRRKILVRLLARASIGKVKDNNGRTALHVAAEQGHTSCISIILEGDSNAIKDIRDNQGNSALHLAASAAHIEACKVLLDFGVDAEAVNSAGRTPMHLAAAMEYSYYVLEELLSRKVPTEHKDSEGNTPLLLAIGKRNICSTKKLLDWGAALSVSNDKGQNCIDMALDLNEKEICLQILSHPRAEEVFKVEKQAGQRTLMKLTERMPDAAEAMLDRSIMISSHPIDNVLLSITYNFRYLEVDPSLTMENTSDHLIPNIMAKRRVEKLLMHPVTLEFLQRKWAYFGRYIYYFNAVLYLCFAIIMSYMITDERIRAKERTIDVINADSTRNILSALQKGDQIPPSTEGKVLASFVLIYNGIMLCFELFQIRKSKGLYFCELSNYMELTLYICSLLYLIEYLFASAFTNTSTRSNLATITLILVYANLLLLFQHISMFKLHIMMLLHLISTILKFIVMFGVLLVGFALIYHLLFPKQNSSNNFMTSLGSLVIMLSGGVKFNNGFTGNFNITDSTTQYPLVPYKDASYLFFVLLALIMIGFTNLLVGLAVGDIQKIRENADMEIQIAKIKYISKLQDSMPHLVRKKIYLTEHVSFPNMSSFFQTITHRFWPPQEKKIIQLINDVKKRSEILEQKARDCERKREDNETMMLLGRSIKKILYRLDKGNT